MCNWLDSIFAEELAAPELNAINPAEVSTAQLFGDNFPFFNTDREEK